MAPKDDYLERILKARVYDVAHETPLERAANLSDRVRNELYLKREDLQPVFSFKLRGAYNKMAHLSPSRLKRGVIASSAGNHAQGVALSARTLGCRAVIVMPVTTPEIKVEAVRKLGGDVRLVGDSFQETAAAAEDLARTEKLTFVHPYDDPDVIAGQGTIGMEILRQVRGPLDAIFVPVGGGGLMAGIASYVKRLWPGVNMIGVEPTDAASMTRSIAAGRRIRLREVGLFADGVAVKQVGKETFRLCRELVDDMITVDTDATCAAIKDVFEDTRSILEPAGAISIAGAKAYAREQGWTGKTLVALACGANMNFDRLRHVSERSEIGEQREALLAVTIPERPGSFKAFCTDLGKRSVTEFNYRYAGPGEAHIFVGVQVRNREEVAGLVRRLNRRGYATLDLSGDELAKLHLRHLVGGRAPGLADERLVRFEFPERPGALMNFLQHMPPDWNISLFHYRNHGTDVGRVLAGIQVPYGERRGFRAFLKDLHYPCWDETDHPAYSLFLSGPDPRGEA